MPSIKWTKYIPHEPTPKQLAFLSLPHEEAFYGGAAGGGKSDALLMAALQYVDVPEYSAILFRRTYADMKLPSSILNRALQWLSPFLETKEVRYRPTDNHTLTFPSGAQIAFGYLSNEGIEARYQSSEYQFCIAENTKVLMEDGSYIPIQHLRIDDQVQTMEGPKSITKVHSPRRKFCVKIRNQIQGFDHKLLTPNNTWVSYDQAVFQAVQRSTRYYDDYKSDEPSKELSQEFHKPSEYSLRDSQPTLLFDRPTLSSSSLQELFSLLKDDRNGSSRSNDLSRGILQLPKLSFPLMLHSPSHQKEVSYSTQHVEQNALQQLIHQDSQSDYPTFYDSYGGYDNQLKDAVQYGPQLQEHAAKPFHYMYVDSSHQPSPLDTYNYQYGYSHPYTKEVRPLVETIVPHQDTIEPFGFSNVYDITVDTSSNYITENGLCQSNCAFDELTHFHEHEYIYLFSRMRRPQGSSLPLRMRSASNPGGRGMRWVRERFAIQKDKKTGLYVGHNPEIPFIPASILDNPFIDPKYLKTLDKLGKIERERLKYGNWEISEDAIFDARWFTDRWFKKGPYYNVITKAEHKCVHEKNMFIFSTVDCASSVKTGVNKQVFYKDRQPSWSVIGTFALTPKGDMLWIDNVRMQQPIPNVVDRICDNHKINKPLFTRVEANGVGQSVYQLLERRGLPVRPVNTQYDKIVNSTAAQLRAEHNQIFLPKFAPWLKPLEDELYMWTGHPDDIDDQIDVLSSAANEASERMVGMERDIQLRRTHKESIPLNTGGLFCGPSYHRIQQSRTVLV